MIDDNKLYVVCSPIGDRPIDSFVEGSVERKCSECGISVMISPATLKTKEEKGAEIVCVPCAAPSMNSQDNTVVTSQLQHEELMREFKKSGIPEPLASAMLEDLYKKYGRKEL